MFLYVILGTYYTDLICFIFAVVVAHSPLKTVLDQAVCSSDIWLRVHNPWRISMKLLKVNMLHKPFADQLKKVERSKYEKTERRDGWS